MYFIITFITLWRYIIQDNLLKTTYNSFLDPGHYFPEANWTKPKPTMDNGHVVLFQLPPGGTTAQLLCYQLLNGVHLHSQVLTCGQIDVGAVKTMESV